MTDREKLGEVAALVQDGEFKKAQNLMKSIKDKDLKDKAKTIIDCVKVVWGK